MIMRRNGKAMRDFILSLFFINLFALSALTAHSAQKQDDDDLRRVWNKKFVEERQKNANAQPARPSGVKPAKSSARMRTREVEENQPNSVPAAAAAASSPAERLDGELIGVTFWQLADATAKAGRDKPRIMVQQPNGRVSRLVAERVTADTLFKTSQRVRIGVEVPRGKESYLYVIDREVYADGTMSVPYLIFPSQTTPPGGNVATSGKLIYVPAQGDPIPYFNIHRDRSDQVSELLTIIVSPVPLDVRPGPPNAPTELDPALVAQWERQWGGRTERRELRGGAGAKWTAKEKEAGEGKRKLLQNDPLPQTVYFVAGKRGDQTLVNVPLRIAP